LLIDMHVHTSRYSPCGRAAPETMAAAAMDAGLDAMVLTEHDKIWPYDHWYRLQRQFPSLKVFRGIEVTSLHGEHYLVIGMLEPGLFWEFIDEPTLFETVEENQAAIIHAHPFRYRDKLVPEVLHRRPHAVEYMSNNVRPDMQPLIKQLARHHGCGLTAASDAHDAEVVGLYAVQLPDWPETEQQLAHTLRTQSHKLKLVEPRSKAAGQ